jgi:hypothetical protein
MGGFGRGPTLWQPRPCWQMRVGVPAYDSRLPDVGFQFFELAVLHGCAQGICK